MMALDKTFNLLLAKALLFLSLYRFKAVDFVCLRHENCRLLVVSLAWRQTVLFAGSSYFVVDRS